MNNGTSVARGDVPSGIALFVLARIGACVGIGLYGSLLPPLEAFGAGPSWAAP